MKLEKYALIAEILSAGAVVASLIFVGISIQQNNSLMAAEARFNRLAVANENNDLIIGSAEIAEIYFKDRNNEELTALEQFRLDTVAQRLMLVMEWSFLEIPRSELPIDRWRRSVQASPARQALYWRNKGSYNPEFEQWFEETILKP